MFEINLHVTLLNSSIFNTQCPSEIARAKIPEAYKMKPLAKRRKGPFKFMLKVRKIILCFLNKMEESLKIYYY